MAMTIAGKYEFDDLYPRHWERFAKETGLGPSQMKRKLIDFSTGLPKTAFALREQFGRNGHRSVIIHRIVDIVDRRCRQTLDRFERGG